MYSKIQLIGRMSRDVEVKQTERMKVGKFSIAVDRKYKNKKSVSFFNCVAFGDSVDVLDKYVKKGQMIHIDGEPVLESYTDKSGIKKTVLTVYVKRFTIIEWNQSPNNSEDNHLEDIFSIY